MRCGNRRKFDAERSITKFSKNRQSMTSVYWRVGLKGRRWKITRSHFIKNTMRTQIFQTHGNIFHVNIFRKCDILVVNLQGPTHPDVLLWQSSVNDLKKGYIAMTMDRWIYLFEAWSKKTPSSSSCKPWMSRRAAAIQSYRDNIRYYRIFNISHNVELWENIINF
jgi:hypothetical protein